tara:strand:+ start:587 stop:760 length:174 start_codon:yes stop_codon:yes gene_type:complete
MMEMIEDIVRYENGEMNEEQEIEFFQSLLDTGIIFSLQGHYQRQMDRMIENGVVNND